MSPPWHDGGIQEFNLFETLIKTSRTSKRITNAL